MTTYATAIDIERIYGRYLLDAVADRDTSGIQDQDAIESALITATDEINAYIGSRYSVPLNPVPPYIRQMCVDIAVYRLALDVGPRTDEMRLRYDDHIKYLKDVAAGRVDLPGFVPTDPGDGGGSSGGGPNTDTPNTLGPGAKILPSIRG